MAAIASLTASATLTFTPVLSDLNDLDHHYSYMWKLGGLDTTQTYTSASLKITNINNWDLTKNMLFIHLFDTALSSPSGSTTTISGSGNNIVTSFQDVALNQVPVTTISDSFGPGSIASNPLVKQSNASNILLAAYVDGSFTGTPTLVNGVSVPNYQTGTFIPPSNPNLPQTITYNFNASQLATLNSYIQGGDSGKIAFGFDSDCHFYNDGIEFSLGSTAAAPPVPEPSTTLAGIACLFPVLASVFGRRRRP